MSSGIKVLEPLSVDVPKMLEYYNRFQDFKKKILTKEDVVSINNKPFIKRSGWQKIALGFNISTTITKESREDRQGYFVYRIWVEAKAGNGRTEIGDGACASNERKFAHEEHDVYAIAHTRATNRAISNLVGSGEVSAEEMEGITNHGSQRATSDSQTMRPDQLYCECQVGSFDLKGTCGKCGKLDPKFVAKQKEKLGK